MLALTLSDESQCPWYCDTAVGVTNADGTQLRVLDKAYTCFGGCGAAESYVLGAPEWLGDSGRLAYSITRGGECYVDDRVPCGTDVLVANAAGTEINLLIRSGGFPSWRR
jgi:hypothetical protein